MFIYHIVLPDVWETFKDKDFYWHESMESEGFIHCSYMHQIESVLKRYYCSAVEVLILQLDTEKLDSNLVEEPSTNNEVYPHVYGPLNIEAIVDVHRRII